MKPLPPAERVLRGLGITEPHEIDVEAISWHLGVRVKVAELDGCEARIVGYHDRAIIRVDRRGSPRRRRFSIAHELGHWHYHRGQLLFCRPEDIGSHRAGTPAIERVADTYAADLLLPRYLFVPLSREHAKLSFRVVRALADVFDASLTATAIRLIESRHSPAMLICHSSRGREWFARSFDVPRRWFPRDALDPESYAFELLFGQGQEQVHPRLIGADAWFDRDEAVRYELQEHSVRSAPDEVMTLLLFGQEQMLED